MNNGTIILSNESYQFSNVIIYDTTIKASHGSPMSAKIVIAGLDTFPDGHIVFAIAKGGPMYPFGYL